MMNYVGREVLVLVAIVGLAGYLVGAFMTGLPARARTRKTENA